MNTFFSPRPSSHFVQKVFALWLMALCALAQAQPAEKPWAKGETLRLDAEDSAGRPFAGDRLKGQVVVVFVWSTACAVCRDSLPELRANAGGWKNKPFSLVAVNVDPLDEDWRRYESLVTRTQMPAKNWLSLRLKAPLPAGQRLPLTLLVDAHGKILQRFEGRLAPEVWDSVADLLP